MKKKQSFSRLSAAHKRMAIAIDVLAQIKDKTFNIESGYWASMSEIDPDELLQIKVDQKSMLAGMVSIKMPPCKVCALGACMLSSMRLFNIGSFDGQADFDDMNVQVRRFFSHDQMQLIEYTFERGGGWGGDDLTWEQKGKCQQFSERYKRDKNLARAIFKNIIKNKGEFIP